MKHGFSVRGNIQAEYRVWLTMWQRCVNQKASGYSRYGGRGIAVCPRWKSFVNFISDMGRRPSAQHQIDRKNNDKGYSPENCQWVTRGQQMLNRPYKSKTGIRGVRLMGSRFQARLCKAGVPYVIGTFATVEQAARAYETERTINGT